MITIANKINNSMILEAAFDSKKIDKNIIKKNNEVTEILEKNKAFIYLGKAEDFDLKKMTSTSKKIAGLNRRSYQINVESFITKSISEEAIIRSLVEEEAFKNAEIYNAKTSKKPKTEKLTLINVSKEGKAAYKEAAIFAKAREYTMDLQITPPNVLNSETMAKKIKQDFAKNANISVKVLGSKEAKALGMNLFLSVNKGSEYDAKIVVLEYKGNKSSKEKTVIVGKGITFDGGGYSIKVGRGMIGMKYDMSGAAIVAGAMKAISETKPKKNFAAVLMLSDNMINSKASTPDMVFKAMNGKTVEINNTDAEGRLALADGLTYGAKKLGATRLIDVATLTGAAVAALGHTFTAVWSTTEKGWEDVSKVAKENNDLIWRMPLHEDYIKFMKGSNVADLKNTALDGLAGSSTAAMFLTNFTEGVEFIHMDVAPTADINHAPQGPMIKTLAKI